VHLPKTPFIALFLLGSGAGLAAFAPSFRILEKILPTLSIGVLWCIFSAFLNKPQVMKSEKAGFESAISGWFYQIVLIVMTGLLCYFFELQSQDSQRFQVLDSGIFLRIIQQSPFTLGLLPWVLYSVLGIGWAYFSEVSKKSPLFLENIPALRRSKGGGFLYSLLYDVLYIAMMMPLVFVGSLSFVVLCETVTVILELDSIFHQPLRSVFIMTLLILVFRKPMKKFLENAQKWKISLGKLLGVYVLLFSFFFLWLHAASGWVQIPLETTAAQTMDVSPLMKSFTESAISTRLHYLILGWWLVWLPWMASTVARASLGRSPIGALGQTLLIPLGFFVFLLPKVTDIDYLALKSWLELPEGLAVSALLLMGFMQKAWGKMKRLEDVFWGAMLPFQRLSHRPFSRWVEMLFLWSMCYPICWFVSGWLPMQIIVSFGTFFIILVSFIYLSTWGAFLGRRAVLKRYKVQE
jgi:hypothetical protein